MAQSSKNQLLVQVRDLIKSSFDKEEIRSLCFHLGIEYDDLRGETLFTRIESLVVRMSREGRLNDLLRTCADLRSDVVWPELSDPTNQYPDYEEPSTRQTLRRIPVWGWIGGAVVIALTLFGIFQLVNGGGNGSPAAPGISSTRIRPVDEAVMVYVPSGNFMMGSDDGEGDEQPVHEVYLDAYWIDQTEVTNAQFAQFVAATGYETTAEQEGTGYAHVDGSWGLVDGADWQHPSGSDSSVDGLDEHPVVQVCWDDAVAYCQWAGSRLPTEAEWEKAGAWDEASQESRTYPWGEDISCDLANYRHCVDNTTAVGSYRNGASSYGVFDMAGNVWEWIADWYGGDYYQNSPAQNPQGPDSGNYRVLRGGSWFNYDNGIRAAYRNGSGYFPAFRSYFVGFRCAQE